MVKIPFQIRPQSACLLAAALISMLLLSGCSGGGKEAVVTQPQAATATFTGGLLKLGAVGTATDLIAGMDLLINLPAGVTVNANPSSGEAASGVVAISGAAAAGSNSLVVAKYAPAAADTPATLHIVVINAAGFSPGEFATVKFNLAAGASLPALNAFTIANFSAKGLDSSTLSGITGAPLSVVGVGNAAANKQTQALVVVTGDQLFLTIRVDTPTKNSSQTITGTLKPGDTLTITTNTAATVGAPVITGGTWSAPVSGLVEGANTITVTETNGPDVVATVSAPIIFDITPPFINIDTAIGGKITNSAGVAGTAEVGSKIVVNCDNNLADVIFFDDLFQNITRWSAMVLGQLHEGDNYCRVIATDAAGNINTKEVDFFFDDIPPDLDIHFDEFIKYGSFYNLYGTVEGGVTPSVSVSGGATVGPLTVNGNTWSTQVSGLAAGPNTITVTATDTAGNVTTRTVTVTTVSSTGSFSGALMPTIADSVTALRMAVGISAPTALDLLRGDLLADGKIDVGDAIMILKKIVGM